MSKKHKRAQVIFFSSDFTFSHLKNVLYFSKVPTAGTMFFSLTRSLTHFLLLCSPSPASHYPINSRSVYTCRQFIWLLFAVWLWPLSLDLLLSSRCNENTSSTELRPAWFVTTTLSVATMSCFREIIMNYVYNATGTVSLRPWGIYL